MSERKYMVRTDNSEDVRWGPFTLVEAIEFAEEGSNCYITDGQQIVWDHTLGVGRDGEVKWLNV